MYITISGNIGSGKKALAVKLSTMFGWQTCFEDPSLNPYLTDFYKDMKRWSFNLQIYLLTYRLQQIERIQSSKQIIIQDRSIYEDVHVFSKSLFEMGLFEPRDYETYLGIFERVQATMPHTDLMIYLKSTTSDLIQRIKKRNRPYEKNIDAAYLARLNDHYEGWIASYDLSPILVIDCQNEDPLSDAMLTKIAQQITFNKCPLLHLYLAFEALLVVLIKKI